MTERICTSNSLPCWSLSSKSLRAEGVIIHLSPVPPTLIYVNA